MKIVRLEPTSSKPFTTASARPRKRFTDRTSGNGFGQRVGSNVAMQRLVDVTGGQTMDMKTVNQILNDFGTHDWVKRQYRVSIQRDIVDALNDTEIFLEMLKARYAQMTKEVA